MVVDMETEYGLKRHAVMVVAKKIWLAHANLLYYKDKNNLLLICTPIKKFVGPKYFFRILFMQKNVIYSPSIFI